jgi:hypothetical protein
LARNTIHPMMDICEFWIKLNFHLGTTWMNEKLMK